MKKILSEESKLSFLINANFQEMLQSLHHTGVFINCAIISHNQKLILISTKHIYTQFKALLPKLKHILYYQLNESQYTTVNYGNLFTLSK